MTLHARFRATVEPGNREMPLPKKYCQGKGSPRRLPAEEDRMRRGGAVRDSNGEPSRMARRKNAIPPARPELACAPFSRCAANESRPPAVAAAAPPNPTPASWKSHPTARNRDRRTSSAPPIRRHSSGPVKRPTHAVRTRRRRQARFSRIAESWPADIASRFIPRNLKS
jgi:hypothetical protein